MSLSGRRCDMSDVVLFFAATHHTAHYNFGFQREWPRQPLSSMHLNFSLCLSLALCTNPCSRYQNEKQFLIMRWKQLEPVSAFHWIFAIWNRDGAWKSWHPDSHSITRGTLSQNWQQFPVQNSNRTLNSKTAARLIYWKRATYPRLDPPTIRTGFRLFDLPVRLSIFTAIFAYNGHVSIRSQHGSESCWNLSIQYAY